MLVSLQKPTYLGLIPIGYGISLIIRNILDSQLIKPHNILINNTLLTSLMMIGEMLGGVLIFIQKQKTAAVITTKFKKPLFKNAYATKVHKFSKFQKVAKHRRNMVITYIVIFFIALLDALAMYFKNYFVEKEHTYFDFILNELIHVFNAVLCLLILKIKLFRHHSLGIVLVFIGFFFANAIELTKIPIEILNLILGVIFAFAFSILEILGKYVMDSKYINPYRLLFFQGLFGVIFFSIICGITNIIVIYNSNIDIVNQIKAEFDNVLVIFNDAGTFFICFAYILMSALVNIGVVLTNYYYTPISRAIIECKVYFFSWLIEIIDGLAHSVGFVVLEVFGFGFLVVGGLVYHEIAILHFFGLEKYTKREISCRGFEDSEQATDDLQKMELVDAEYPLN